MTKRLQPGDAHYGVHMSHCYSDDEMSFGGYHCCKYGEDDICPMAPTFSKLVAKKNPARLLNELLNYKGEGEIVLQRRLEENGLTDTLKKILEEFEEEYKDIEKEILNAR